MIEYKILRMDEFDEIEKIDQIRLLSFDQKEGTDYFTNCIKNGRFYAIEMMVDGVVVGGAYVYVSPNTNSLNVERIFVLQEYRNQHYASYLLKYINDHKGIFEDYSGIEIHKSYVEPQDDELISFYKKNGYRGPNSLNIMSKELTYHNEDHKHK